MFPVAAPLDASVHEEVKDAERLHLHDGPAPVAHEQRLGADLDEPNAAVSLRLDVDCVSVGAELADRGDRMRQILGLSKFSN